MDLSELRRSLSPKFPRERERHANVCSLVEHVCERAAAKGVGNTALLCVQWLLLTRRIRLEDDCGNKTLDGGGLIMDVF
jgi:hypothetical protein